MVQGANIQKIYEAIFNRLNKVCNKSEIELIIAEYNKRFDLKLKIESTIKYLSRHKYIKRIFLNYYYINSLDEREQNFCKFEDKELLFAVLNKLDLKWYLGLSSALYESGASWQIPVVLNIVNTKFSGVRKVLGLRVKFYKIKENLIIGLKKAKTKNKIFYYYSCVAKTYLDLVYLKVSNKLKLEKDTAKYLKDFPKWVEKK